ncbi:hypothetical protein V8C44DRAFT_329258, partial [Trichoderma aethiopicum]
MLSRGGGGKRRRRGRREKRAQSADGGGSEQGELAAKTTGWLACLRRPWILFGMRSKPKKMPIQFKAVDETALALFLRGLTV